MADVPGPTLLHRRPGDEVVTTLQVEVVDGPDRGSQASSHDALSVGTAKDNALVVSDFTVSRYHLEVAVRPGGLVVTDLGSTNGTYVGAVRIERAIIPAGTVVQLGGTTIRFVDAIKRTAKVDDRVHDYGGMRARSPQLIQLFADIERVAATPTAVLVVGESGTGKERVAEALHARSPRAALPFVTIDCGALPSALLASELFGHERGAFTGAGRTHVGAFERAEGGTMFLDEIGELPPADQAALLGVLERKRFRRVGGTADIELRARVIAATNRDLRAEVNSARFRHDLYHRLAVLVLRLPPLRERREDILPLVEHFAREFGAAGPIEDVFGAEVLARWLHHPWPGNVRELRNAVEVTLIMGSTIGDPVRADTRGETITTYKDARTKLINDFELTYLTQLMAVAAGNVSLAARTARMDRSHLIDLLHRHGLKS